MLLFQELGMELLSAILSYGISARVKKYTLPKSYINAEKLPILHKNWQPTNKIPFSWLQIWL
jgi:hypothetical protein